MVHWNEKLTIDGKLNKAKIMAEHPECEQLFDAGLDFFIWKAQSEEDYPELPDIAQRALNAKYSVQQGQDIFQVLMRAIHCWQNGVGLGSSERSLFIVRDILKANPNCSPADVEAVVEIGRKFGGRDASTVAPLRIFFSSFKQRGRTIATSTLQAIAQIKLAPDELCPSFMISIILSLASFPTPNSISASDVKGITSKIGDMISCEQMINSMVEIVKQLGAPSDRAAKIIGEFRTALVLKFFKKIKKLESDSYDKIASSTFCKLLPLGKTRINDPWAEVELCKGAKSKGKGKGGHENDDKAKGDKDVEGAGTDQQVIEYRDGKPVGIHMMILTKKGFKKGGLVKLKETGSHHKS